ncbi:COA8 family protein CG14806, mitochondrial [Contarinia nasturtii]|uniref:COA8 family protein CG14806, mitochondrial n=1 Tax=Contarinia nasturtii TaxID=265458 RepID=UPI0012D486C5|nr:COA8 family protein CG14806, mitochondrial [Contarinia nasturtii]
MAIFPNISRNIRRNFNNIQKLSIAQYSSEHRIKRSKNQQKVGFESKPNSNQINSDYIGPPDKISNLRPVLRYIPKDETPIEKELRLKRIAAEEWNQTFWTQHNQKFVKEKQAFIKANKEAEEDTLSADKMSEFYKSFLDSNWKSHFQYNREWYKKNFEILLLSYRTKFQLKRWLKLKTNP